MNRRKITKRRKISRRGKISRRNKTLRRNKISRRRKLGGSLYEDMAKVDSNKTLMIITYLPKGSPDEDEYLKNIDKNDDSRVGSFVIKLNNQDGGAIICTDGDTRTPVQTYTDILDVIWHTEAHQNEIARRITRSLQGIDAQSFTGVAGSTLLAQVPRPHVDGAGQRTIIINLNRYEMEDDLPNIHGQRVSHATLHPPHNNASLNPRLHGNYGANHIQTDQIAHIEVAGLQWQMCAEYDCAMGLPIDRNNVIFSIRHRWNPIRVSHSGDREHIMRTSIDTLGTFMQSIANPLPNLPAHDEATKVWLLGKLREACEDINADVAANAMNARQPAVRRYPNANRGFTYQGPNPWMVPVVVAAVAGPTLAAAMKMGKKK